MADRAFRDVNRITTLLAVSNSDGTTPVVLYADPTTHRLLMDVSIISTLTTPITGQLKIAVTGTAIQFPSNILLNGVIITADSGNAAVVTLGASNVTNTVNGTGNGYILQVGSSTSAAVINTNDLWLNGTAGDFVSYIGS